MERETGFEPATPTLARWCSTPELFPLYFIYFTTVLSKKTVAMSRENAERAYAQVARDPLAALCPLWPLLAEPFPPPEFLFLTRKESL